MDGERIEGTWRHAFICNIGTYYLIDLLIYADGMVDCWGLVTLDEFATKLASGWVATELPDGARASAHHLASWKFAEPSAGLTAEMLLGEVRDDIDQLNGRADSTARCLAALDVFRDQPTDDNRAALREAYEAIPEHLRTYALGDQDNKDQPLQALIAGPDNHETYAAALDYFTDREQEEQCYADKTPADGPTEPVQTSVIIDQTYFPRGWPQDSGILVLRNEFPAPITVGEQTYPTVTHAYWALAVADDQQQTAIRRAGWPQARTAIMAQLLRIKFSQHPDLARTLTGTGTTRLLYTQLDSTFWGQRGEEGRNWMGRLLELIRAELAVSGMDIPL